MTRNRSCQQTRLLGSCHGLQASALLPSNAGGLLAGTQGENVFQEGARARARRGTCGDQDGALAALELVQRAQPLGLAHLPVDGQRVEAQVAQLAPHPGRQGSTHTVIPCPQQSTKGMTMDVPHSKTLCRRASRQSGALDNFPATACSDSSLPVWQQTQYVVRSKAAIRGCLGGPAAPGGACARRCA